MQNLISKHFIFFFICSLLTVFIFQKYFIETPQPIYDALRYVKYGVNVEEQAIFGLEKNNDGRIIPGNENTPLYPFLIATSISLDDNLKQDLICLLKDKSCSVELDTLIYIQCFFIVLTLCSIWLTALLLTSSKKIAWTSALFALLSGELFYFANRILTESLIIPLFSIFVLNLCLAFKSEKLCWHAIAASLLGLLTLTRPEYHYLFIVIILFQFLYCLHKKTRHSWKSLCLVIVTYFLIVGPWQARNYHHFDNPSLTGDYGGIILAYRVAYNRMTWPEWAVSFIYWFPDSGDSISKKLFPKEYYEKLNFDEGSYFLTESKKVFAEVKTNTESQDQALAYLLKEEIFGNIFKHSMVTIPIFWRGIFISKYWGVVGLLCFIIILSRYSYPINQQLVLLSLPAWFVAFLHAFVSVNMPRYNLVLIPFYSISVAIVLLSIDISFFKNIFLRDSN